MHTEKNILSTLKNSALRYLGRYNASSGTMQKHLHKKSRTIYKDYYTDNITIYENIILQVIEYLVSNKYLDDNKYITDKSKSLLNKGKSNNFVNSYLYSKGFKKLDLSTIVQNNQSSNSELYAIINYVKRKRFFCFSIKNYNEEEFLNIYEKQKANLGRNGFSYDSIKFVSIATVNELEELQQTLKEELNL